MKAYIANFGSGNWAWPNCLERHAIAVMDDMPVHPYWQRGDPEGYVREAMRVLKTMKGKPPTRSVASRCAAGLLAGAALLVAGFGLRRHW